MSKVLSFNRRILAAIVLSAITLSVPVRGSAAIEACQTAFSETASLLEQQWPPANWSKYLEKYPNPIEKLPLVENFPPEDIANPATFDSRFFSLHRYLKSFPKGEIEMIENSVPELDLPESNYSFVSSFRRKPGGDLKGPFGEFLVVKSKSSGRIITVPGLTMRAEGIHRKKFISEFNAYTAFCEQMMKEKKFENPELDYFFSALDKLKSKTGVSPWKALEDDSWKVSPYRFAKPEDTRSESVVTERFNDGEDQRLATRTTYKRGNVWVTIQDSFIQRDIVKKNKAKPATDQEIASGLATRRRWLDEIVSVLYPEYVARRKWTKEFIESDYKEVLESADRTRYIIVRADDGKGNPGKVIASIGLNRAPYSSFARAPDGKWGWRRFMMAGGYHFLRDFVGPGYADKSFVSGTLPMHSMPILKMEKYLGVHLERPVAVDAIFWKNPGISRTGRMRSLLPTMDGEGIIYEPVKFYLDPTHEAGTAPLVELVSVMAESLFPSHQDPEFSLKAQWLYTFNPLREGQLLYAKRGYKTDPRYQSVTKDGVEWHVFGQSPGEFLSQFLKLTPEDQKIEAGIFIQSLQETVNQLSPSKNSKTR